MSCSEEKHCFHSEEAQRMWEKREAEWAREKRARERLMQEVRAVTSLTSQTMTSKCVVWLQPIDWAEY